MFSYVFPSPHHTIYYYYSLVVRIRYVKVDEECEMYRNVVKFADLNLKVYFRKSDTHLIQFNVFNYLLQIASLDLQPWCLQYRATHKTDQFLRPLALNNLD